MPPLRLSLKVKSKSKYLNGPGGTAVTWKHHRSSYLELVPELYSMLITPKDPSGPRALIYPETPDLSKSSLFSFLSIPTYLNYMIGDTSNAERNVY